MKRNFLLIGAILIAVILGVNSAKKILSFHGTSQKVEEAQKKLEDLKEEKEALKRDLAYKKSDEFKEKEIRNKLGLAKPGETVVIIPKEGQEATTGESKNQKANWQKWKELFFGS